MYELFVLLLVNKYVHHKKRDTKNKLLRQNILNYICSDKAVPSRNAKTLHTNKTQKQKIKSEI